MTNDQDAAMANAEKRSGLPQVEPAPMLTGAGLVGFGGQRVVTRRSVRAADVRRLLFDGGRAPLAMGDSVEDGRASPRWRWSAGDDRSPARVGACACMDSDRARGRRYRLVLRGELGEPFRFLFEGMQMERVAGATVLTGNVVAQTHLHGLLERVQELGLRLVSIGRQTRGQIMTERPASNEQVHPADAFHPVRHHARQGT